MRLSSDPRFPQVNTPNFLTQLTTLYRQISQQLNGVTEGSIQAITNSGTTAPTMGTYQKGDFIRNSSPSELGTAASKYVITGFLCITAGEPGAWVQCRSLTGN